MQAVLRRWRSILRGEPLRERLQRMVASGQVINILQVGANDGVINDPLYGFVRAHPGQTRIVLVEPQAGLIPALAEAYAFHPAKMIFEGAVGPACKLVLHRVRPDCWADLVVPYAKGWPAYRAPTGVTSALRDSVIDWVRQHYQGSLPPEAVVEAVEVEAVEVPILLERMRLFERPDVLVIDAEGFDDVVLAASDIPGLRPKLIQFEAVHLDAARLAAVRADLEAQGYRLERQGINMLAELG